MTAANAFLSTEIPTSRRAEGMSHYGNAIKLAMAIGPAIGLVLAHRNQYQELFWVAGGTALLTLAMVLFLTPQATQVAVSTPKRTGKLFNKHAAFPGLVMTANSVVFGTLIPFTPMLSVEKGFGPEISWFYGIYAFSLIFSRALTGPLSDRYGRDRVIVPGMIGVVISVLLLAMAMHPVFFLLSAACYGVCAGTVQPSLMAMVADRVPANERGSGMATFTLFTELGVAGGTYLTGSLGPLVGYGNVLYGIAGITLIGLVGFLAGQRLQKPPVKKEEAYA
jgi:MFS family permease